MKKNIENSGAPSRMPTTLAPVSVLMRKIRNGTRGALRARLDRHECPDQRHRQREQGDDLGRAPQYGAREHPVRCGEGRRIVITVSVAVIPLAAPRWA